MKNKKETIICLILAVVLLLVLLSFVAVIALKATNRTYDDYDVEEETSISAEVQYSDNKLIDNGDYIENAVLERKEDLALNGVNNVLDYEVSFSSNNTLVTVIYELSDKTVYLSLRFSEDLSNVENWEIFDDQEAD
jgi:hypothetical protein